jgi:hypothetical protein
MAIFSLLIVGCSSIWEQERITPAAMADGFTLHTHVYYPKGIEAKVYQRTLSSFGDPKGARTYSAFARDKLSKKSDFFEIAWLFEAYLNEFHDPAVWLIAAKDTPTGNFSTKKRYHFVAPRHYLKLISMEPVVALAIPLEKDDVGWVAPPILFTNCDVGKKYYDFNKNYCAFMRENSRKYSKKPTKKYIDLGLFVDSPLFYGEKNIPSTPDIYWIAPGMHHGHHFGKLPDQFESFTFPFDKTFHLISRNGEIRIIRD